MPNPNVQPLFDREAALKVGFYVGYAELTPEGHRYNSAYHRPSHGRTLQVPQDPFAGLDRYQAGQKHTSSSRSAISVRRSRLPLTRAPAEWGMPQSASDL